MHKCFGLTGLVLALALSVCGAQAATNVFDLMDKFDTQDQRDLNELLDQANRCTAVRDFSCAEARLKTAAKLTSSEAGRKSLASAQGRLVAEQHAVAEEERQERERIRLAEERIRLAEERAEKRERLREERERQLAQQRDAEDRANAAQASRQAYADIFNDAAKKINDYRVQSGQQMNEVYRLQNEALAQKAAKAREAQRQHDEDRQERQAAEDERRAMLERKVADVERRKIQAERDAAAERRIQLAELQETERQRKEAEQLRQSRERERQAKEQEAERQRKQEQDRLANEEEARRLKAEQEPKLGGPPNKDGCWIPDRNRSICLHVSSTLKNSEVRTKFLNNCPWGIVVGAENQRKDGSWDGGQEHMGVGQTFTWSSSNATGEYRYKFTGSNRASNDWVCIGADPAMNN